MREFGNGESESVSVTVRVNWLWLALVVVTALVTGCKHGSSNTVTVTPSSVTVLVNGNQQFTESSTNSTATVTWAVNGINGGNNIVGTIDSTGYYTAPAVVPANTTITVSASQAGATGTATVTLDSGVRVSINQASVTVGTGETYPFSAQVTGVPLNAVVSGTCSNVTNSPVPCTAVTWSVTSGSGSIGSGTGIFTAPASAGSVTITATSVYDTTQKATATISVVTAANPTVTSISPSSGAVGAFFEDVYLTGTNFISTTNVFINNSQLSTFNISVGSNNTTLLVRVPDSFLTTPGTLNFTIARQGGAQQSCTNSSGVADPALCELVLSPVRPAIVGTTVTGATADSIPVGSSVVNFNVNGGYFGTPSNPSVFAQFADAALPVAVSTSNPDRQMSVTIGGSQVSTPGLFPVTVLQQGNQGPGAPRAVTNVAIQPTYSTAPSQIGSPLSVGSQPAAVAVNTATGIAVVANTATNDVTLINVAGTPSVLGFICTGATPGATNASLTATESNSCPASGPVSVAVDDLHDIALVANSSTANPSIAVIDLNAQKVDVVVPSAIPNTTQNPAVPFVPAAVGVNPESGTGIVAYRTAGFASLLDLTQLSNLSQLQASPQTLFKGVVSISNGPNPHIAISTKLNWAIVTPGGSFGSLSIVDLGQQSTFSIAATNGISCSSGVLTVTTTSALQVQIGQAVLIAGNVLSNSQLSPFNGVFNIASIPSSTSFTVNQSTCTNGQVGNGGTINTAAAEATLDTSVSVTGVAFDSQTDKAILVDTAFGANATIFNALDQSSTSLAFPSNAQGGNIAAAINPLDDVGIILNQSQNEAFLINPGNAQPNSPQILNAFSVGNLPVDVAIDPGSDEAIVVNQNDNNVRIYALGTLVSPQLLEASVTVDPASPVPHLPEVTVHSTLSSGVGGAGSPAVSNLTMTLIGSGFVPGTTQVRLDGSSTNITTNVLSSRVLTAVVPASMQMGPRRYALDVVNGGAVSNALSFTVMQSIDLAGTCAAPAPQGVAIDPTNNVAVVTDVNCNDAYILNLTAGAAMGTGPAVAVGSQPLGVDVLPASALAVVANFMDNTASIVNEVNGAVVATVTTDSGPTGVAIDPILGQAAVSATGANVLDTFTVSSSPGTSTSLAVGQRPAGVAVNPVTHLAAVANAEDNSVSLVDLTQTNATYAISGLEVPQGMAFDPVSSSFLVASSLGNSVSVITPTSISSASSTTLRVGINPTSVGYNAQSATLVTMNTASNTMTVVDFLDQRVRNVLHVAPSNLFAVAIHPFTNLAVVADSADQRILFLPLPQ